jgi:alpha-L-fucosidase
LKRIAALFLAALLIFACFSGCKKTEEAEELKVPEIEYEVPEWFRDAKFGIFIHYGVYSVPAYGDEWYGHWMYIPEEKSYGGDTIYDYHLKTYGGPDKVGYKDFIPDFLKGISTWQKNNGAEQWAQLFEDAGAKYVVPVGIHHDSYALYDSDVQTTYNSVNGAGVDYIGELKKALKERDIKLGISNHFVENDWFFDETKAKGGDLTDPEYAELYGTGGSKTKEHIEKWYAISMEIINKYQPDLIYYDFDLQNKELNMYENANRYLMLQNYYELSKSWEGCEGVVCNYKHEAFTPDIAVLDKEREALGAINPIAWQTDTSVGAKSWGYITNEEYRSGEEFITALIDIVSKNGNLLLNIGPKADGTIPEEAESVLRTIGKWLDTYGDAIYATRPWEVYGEGETENSGDTYQYTGSDIRFTKSKDDTKLYISALGTPENNKISVKTLGKNNWDASSVDKICLINGKGRIELEWNQSESALEINLPKGIEGACAVEVSFKDGKIPELVKSADEIIQADGKEEFNLVFTGGENYLLAEVSADKKGVLTVSFDNQDKQPYTSAVSKSKKTQYVSVPVEGEKGTAGVKIFGTEGVKVERFKFCKKISTASQIEAEDFDMQSGSVRAEDCAEGGKNLGYVGEGDWVCYCAVDFGSGKSKITARLAGSGQKCNVRLDSPDGKIIATLGGEDTGGWTEYKTFDYDMKKTEGIHSVYITYDTSWSDLNINWFSFE